jgi:hypothetical protein
VGIILGIAFIRDFRKRRGIVVVRMVGIIVMIPRMVVTVSLTNFMSMLHLDGQIRASHVSESDGNDQQTLENGSHLAYDSGRL